MYCGEFSFNIVIIMIVDSVLFSTNYQQKYLQWLLSFISSENGN